MTASVFNISSDSPDHETIVLGGGCFWCLEGVYRRMRGAVAVESGYCNGHLVVPTYEQVCTGETGHAEVVKLIFDTREVSLRDVLTVFFHPRPHHLESPGQRCRYPISKRYLRVVRGANRGRAHIHGRLGEGEPIVGRSPNHRTLPARQLQHGRADARPVLRPVPTGGLLRLRHRPED